jgi:starch-binding outer membrane protein, SusD/RagB family
MKKILLFLTLFTGMTLTGCNDSFLEKYPVTSLTEENAFQSYDNFKAFMWPCYEMFSNTNIATSTTAIGRNSHYLGDVYAGYLEQRGASSQNKYAFQTVTNATSGNGWNFSSFIRRINIMLSHVDDSNMTEEEKNHWKSVGYFFHSFWYMELIDRFGDVPWVDTPLDDTSEEAYGSRMPRLEVADKVLDRLLWAESNIGNTAIYEKKDGSNTINQNCVRAAISRFTLREGTWRKYHELGSYDRYFTECKRVSKLLMQDYPSLYTGTDGQPGAGYGEMWTTDDLSTVPGIILYQQWLETIKPGHSCYYEHTSSHDIEMHQGTVDLYLCKDGKTISNSELYAGDKDIYSTFRNRDPRMYHTIMPPYKVVDGKGDYTTWSYTSDPADREYIDIMGPNKSCSNPGVGMKRLPGQNWSASLVRRVPNLQGGAQYTIEGKKYGPHAYVACRSGYYVWKNWDNWEENYNNAQVNTADKPIFKIEEILLNYAEAMYETGAFDQNVAEETINKLRTRAGVEKMTVANIDENFDPKRGKYYPKNNTTGILVDPVLWEIRRERIIELMGEGFGFYDVRRWRMAPWFVNMQQKGMWISKNELSSLTLLNETTGTSDGANGSMTEGYIYLFNDPIKEGKGWLEKYYLYQVPLEEIALIEVTPSFSCQEEVSTKSSTVFLLF